MKSVIAAVVAALVLVGCTAGRSEPQVTRVYVRVPEPCIKNPPEAPVYRTGQGLYPGDKQAVAILADDFERAERYGTAWETAAISCVVDGADED